jgi:hypothetical protein
VRAFVHAARNIRFAVIRELAFEQLGATLEKSVLPRLERECTNLMDVRDLIQALPVLDDIQDGTKLDLGRVPSSACSH